jgi:hypothetical protein
MKIMTAEEARERQRTVALKRESAVNPNERELVRLMLESVDWATKRVINYSLLPPKRASIVVEELPRGGTKWTVSGADSWREEGVSIEAMRWALLQVGQALKEAGFTVDADDSHKGTSLRTLLLAWSWEEEDK